MTCGIYLITNKINGHMYVGQSSNIEERWKSHIKKSKSKDALIVDRAINKYGSEKFSLQIITTLPDIKSIKNKHEKYWIKFYNTYENPNHYNQDDGGTFQPDNKNENHGQYRHDIDNEKIKKMYLSDYNSEQIANFFHCSKRTINRRLKKIFGQKKYDELKRRKQVTNVRKKNKPNPNIKTDEILFYAKQGYNSVEIGKILNCSDSTVMDRLKKILSPQEYEKYKKNNLYKKMKKIRSKKQ